MLHWQYLFQLVCDAYDSERLLELLQCAIEFVKVGVELADEVVFLLDYGFVVLWQIPNPLQN